MCWVGIMYFYASSSTSSTYKLRLSSCRPIPPSPQVPLTFLSSKWDPMERFQLLLPDPVVAHMAAKRFGSLTPGFWGAQVGGGAERGAEGERKGAAAEQHVGKSVPVGPGCCWGSSGRGARPGGSQGKGGGVEGAPETGVGCGRVSRRTGSAVRRCSTAVLAGAWRCGGLRQAGVTP